MEIFYTLFFGGILVWWIYGILTRHKRAAIEMDRQFKIARPIQERKPLPADFKFESIYSKWEKEAIKNGFGKLGTIYTEMNENGFIRGTATVVYVDHERTTILAFTRMYPSSRRVDQIELESWVDGNTFLYTTNNLLVYAMKSPSQIIVNKTRHTKVDDTIKDHRNFIGDYKSKIFKRYEKIEDVIQTSELQDILRKELSASKEFLIDEDEANALVNNAGSKNVRKIYNWLRKIKNG